MIYKSFRDIYGKSQLYFLEEKKHNSIMSAKHKKVCRALNYYQNFFIFVSAASGYVSIRRKHCISKTFCTDFLPKISPSRYRMEIKLDQLPLGVEQKMYAIKIATAYIVFDLDAWPRYPTNNSKLKK